MEGTVYDRLMTHFSTLGMGYPPRDVFLDILRESFSPEEAEVLLLLPTRVAPLQAVSAAEAARSR
ncbi:MAG TPA: hypothetical protein VK997_10100, partial [Deferrisomatales bacterium]|nr:hypothetical protein [Deferrisomatales bacterium]